jgi:hypothetical protein
LPISATLRARARSIAEHVPTEFLEALNSSPLKFTAILSAMVADAGNIRVFVTDYPSVVVLVNANTSLAVGAGMVDAKRLESYVQGARGEESATSRPWIASLFESFVGQAVVGESPAPWRTIPPSATRFARDVAFIYSSEALGRDQALVRIERLFGAAQRDRIADDISLDLGVLRAADDDRLRMIRSHIASASTTSLARQREHSDQQLMSLNAFTDGLWWEPRVVARRTAILRLFLSLSNQNLGLRSAEVAASTVKRSEALDAFSDWIDTACA